jgi:hypothetical protein
MARSTSARRHARRVEDLRALRAAAPQQFRRVWQLFFQGWASEVGHRARAQMRDSADERLPAIFAVFDGARRLARDIGADTDRHVAVSLIHLEHLCSKAVAGLMDGRLYAFGVETVYVRRGKARRARGSGPALCATAKPAKRAAEPGTARDTHRCSGTPPVTPSLDSERVIG